MSTSTKTRKKLYETNSKLFGELLQFTLVIPMNQRPFEWAETEMTKYLEDIWKTFHQGKCDFSGGTIITYKDGDSYEIYDGQQRIISTLLILSVLYRFCPEKLQKRIIGKFQNILWKGGCDDLTKEQKRSFSSIKTRFDEIYISDEDEDKFDEDMLPKISCINPTDAFALTSVINEKVKPHNELYIKETLDNNKNKFICKCKCLNNHHDVDCTYSTSRHGDMIKHIQNSHKINILQDSKIYNAYSVVCNYLEEKKKEEINKNNSCEDSWIDILKKIINFILKESWFDVKICFDYDFACQEFDRANNRGTPLYTFDIILNKIMQSDGVDYDKRIVIHDEWVQKINQNLKGNNMQTILENKYGQKLFDIAIQLHNKRCIATSRSNVPEGCDRISMFVNGLLKGHVYSNITSFFKIYETIDDLMKENIMKHPFIKVINSSGKKGSLDWALIHFILQIFYIKKEVDNDLLDLISGWYIRRLVNSEKKPFNHYGYGHVMEKIVAYLYDNPEYNYKKDIMKLLYKFTTSKEDFLTKINKTYPKLSHKDKTNVLKFLELKISRSNDTELCGYTLEHIYSQKQAEIDNIPENIVNLVGNCTLFEGKNSDNGEKGNYSLKNKSFAEKKEVYGTSQSRITLALNDDKWNGFDDGTPRRINERNKIMIEDIEKHSQFWMDRNKNDSENQKILDWLDSDKYLYEA